MRSGVGSAQWNMALDEALWRSFSKVGRPTLRLYRWTRPTLSLGYSQRAEEFDLGECARLGVEIIRRPTGGRAVLHGLEVTYSLVHPLEGMGGVNESHRKIGEALALGLRKLGLAAELVKAERSSLASSAACLEVPSYSELTIAGRKVAGSAQVRNHLALLEHGSLPLELDLERLAAVLWPDGLPRERFKDLLRRRAGGLREFAAQLRLEEVEDAIIAGFAERFEVEPVEGPPTTEELKLAEELVERKYGDSRWNFRR